MIQIKVPRSKSAPRTPPLHISALISFVTANIGAGSLFMNFCRIIKDLHTYKQFQDYLGVYIPQTKEEHNLLKHLSNFYYEAECQGNLDNQRGDLLEYLVNTLLKSGKYQNFHFYYFAELHIIDTGGNIIAKTSPNNIDFYLERRNNNESVGFECKIRLSHTTQLQNFNTFAEKANKFQVSCTIILIHLVEKEQWVREYKRRYPIITFVGPSEMIKTLL